MKVSIAMCSYNVSRFIDRAIQSIQAQTYTNWELIISDDASTDDTVSRVKSYLSDTRIRLIQQPKNLGYVQNKNVCLQQATGDLVTQLDSDDVCEPERLQRQVDAFLKYPDLQACTTGFNLITEEGAEVRAFSGGNDYWIADLMLEYPFSLISIMMRPALWRQFNYYHPFFAGSVGEDHYLVWRVNQQFPIYFINQQLMSYRANLNSVTHTADNPRKLIGGRVLAELRRQMLVDGTDWLAKGEDHKARDYEKQLLDDNKIMSECYRIWAAKAVDKKNFSEAGDFLKASLKLNWRNVQVLPTFAYYLRSKYLKPA